MNEMSNEKMSEVKRLATRAANAVEKLNQALGMTDEQVAESIAKRLKTNAAMKAYVCKGHTPRDAKESTP